MVFRGQNIFMLGSVFFLVLFCGAVYYFDVKAFIAPRSMLLPDIQVTRIQGASQRLPTLSGSLFGVLPESVVSLTETNLNLTLKGTVPAFNKAVGMAVIMVGTKTEQIIHVGETVLPEVTLEAVYEKYVVLSRSNVKEILRFPNSDQMNKPFMSDDEKDKSLAASIDRKDQPLIVGGEESMDEKLLGDSAKLLLNKTVF